MEYLTQRKLPVDFQSPIVQVFNKLTITGKYHLVGSSSLKSILYNSDYDLNEVVKAHGIGALRHIAKQFQKKFQEIDKNPSLFLLDFKCGEMGGKPLRWSAEEVKRGEKTVAGKPVPLYMALSMKSMIKLDMIALIQGVFTEFSEIYFLNVGGKSNQEPLTEEETEEALEKDYEEFHKDGNYWKALKRYFSICRLEPYKHRKQIKILVDFFNGQVGLLNKNKNELDILLSVMGAGKPPKVEDIHNNLQIVKQSISNVFSIPLKETISTEINKMCFIHSRPFLKRNITILRNYFEQIINKESLAFLKSAVQK